MCIRDSLGAMCRDDLGALLRLLASDVDRAHHASVEHALVMSAHNAPNNSYKTLSVPSLAVLSIVNCVPCLCAIREQCRGSSLPGLSACGPVGAMRTTVDLGAT